MIESTHRPSSVIVDLAAIRENVSHEMAQLQTGCELFAVVKANGYGHGMKQVAHEASRAGATGFCVATLDEAIMLRTTQSDPILILGMVSAMDVHLASKHDIHLTLASMNWVKEVLETLKASGKTLVQPLKVHIKIDSGMGRLGFQTKEEIKELLNVLKHHQEAFEVTGIFTHFATADENDETYFDTQALRFQEILKSLPKAPRYVHVSNSATCLWHKEVNGNMVRFGVGLYGLNPSMGTLDSPINQMAALRLESELISVKRIAKGHSISYGATFTTTKDEWIGVVPIGYADGWQRKMQGFHVLIEGVACEIVGRVCMDQFMVRLPKEMAVHTPVTLIGTNGTKEISLVDVAHHLDTIHYEVACLLSDRLPRKYVND